MIIVLLCCCKFDKIDKLHEQYVPQPAWSPQQNHSKLQEQYVQQRAWSPQQNHDSYRYNQEAHTSYRHQFEPSYCIEEGPLRHIETRVYSPGKPTV